MVVCRVEASEEGITQDPIVTKGLREETEDARALKLNEVIFGKHFHPVATVQK